MDYSIDCKLDKDTFFYGTKSRMWWLRVSLHITLLLSGQAISTLLSRLYFDRGGASKWLQTFTLSAAFPLLFLPLLLLHRTSPPDSRNPSPSLTRLASTYVGLGLLGAVNTFLYSCGILYLPVTTFSLVCAAQLGFNAVFSYFINAEKFTHITLNTVTLLAFSTIVLALHSGVAASATTATQAALGVASTLGSCAAYSLMLSLTELTFQKVIRRRTMGAVLQMLIWTAAVATATATAGLAASGEWRGLRQEMEGFGSGRVGYVMTLVWIGVGRQVSNVGLVGLVCEVSSLFSNVISTLSIPLMPVFGLIFFSEKVDGMKVVAFLMAIWGLTSYFYQHYLDCVADKGKETIGGDKNAQEDMQGIQISEH